MKHTEFWEKVNLAKLATLNKKHFAFIGSMMYKLKITPDTSITDIYLDGINSNILINPNWFTKLTPEECASMLAHEVLHYSLQHDLRIGNKEPVHYQKACDEVVNNMLLDFGFKLPMDIEVNRQYQNQSLDLIYKQILAAVSQDNPSNNTGAGSNDLNPVAPPITNQQQNQRNRDINQANTSDMLSGSKEIGTSNEAFKHLFKDINTGKINWLQILAEHFNDLTSGDYSYHDLDRRMLSLGYFEPVSESIGSINRIALALDVSGSVNEEQIRMFLQEIRTIAESLNPETISVCTFNHGLVDIFEFKQGDDLSNISLNIGGGTSLEPVFDYYNNPDNEPEFLIVFSDLKVYPYPKKPKYHTTWICFDNPNTEIPFGKLIHINSKDLS